MKAILVGKNKELLWSEVPDPVLAEDEVLTIDHIGVGASTYYLDSILSQTATKIE